GSNTVLLLAVERRPDGSLAPLVDLSRITRLGRGVDRAGRLDPASAQNTLDTIVEFAKRARELGAGRIIGAATAAVRDAADANEFLARVRDQAGVELDVISGETEAELEYLAVTSGLRLDPAASLLIIDIGGGSTEFIRAEPDHPLETVSLQIGSV